MSDKETNWATAKFRCRNCGEECSVKDFFYGYHLRKGPRTGKHIVLLDSRLKTSYPVNCGPVDSVPEREEVQP